MPCLHMNQCLPYATTIQATLAFYFIAGMQNNNVNTEIMQIGKVAELDLLYLAKKLIK